MRVTIPDGTGGLSPVDGAVVQALTFDPDSARARLQQAAPPPPAVATRFDSLHEGFARPLGEFLATDRALRAARGSGADTLALRALYTAAVARLDTARRRLLPALDSAYQARRSWMKETYAGWDRLATAGRSSSATLRTVDTTRNGGIAVLRVPPKYRWAWVTAPDATDPLMAWQWSVPLDASRIILNPTNGRRVPKE